MSKFDKWRNYQIDFFDENNEIVDCINTNEIIDVIEKQEKILKILKKLFDTKTIMIERQFWNDGQYCLSDCDSYEIPITNEDYEDLMEWLDRK